MRKSKMRNTGSSGAAGARKNFFGNSLQTGFFSGAGNTVQTQPVPKLPEFSANHFVNGNFANFDAQYTVNAPVPAKGTLFITHGVHMNYPATMKKDEQTTFENNFVNSVHDTWSNQHLLALTEPGFSSYMCDVDVSAHVEDNPKDAHTIIDVVKPRSSEKRFRSRVTGVAKKGDAETTSTAKMDFRDPTEEKINQINKADFIQQVGSFDFDSDKINADCKDDIQKIKDFITTIPASKVPGASTFDLHFVGRASSQGSKEYNEKLSERRVQSVEKELGNLPGLGITISEPRGEEEATEDAAFRRVNVGVFVTNNNKPATASQNVAAHEFGHMIGLGDEYIETKPGIPGTSARFFGDNPTHYDLVKKVVDEDAANELLIQDAANIMSLGNEVKRGHYAFFVAALDIMTRPEIEKATGKKDAKWLVL